VAELFSKPQPTPDVWMQLSSFFAEQSRALTLEDASFSTAAHEASFVATLAHTKAWKDRLEIRKEERYKKE
jgi:hypothetical protein